MFTHFFSLPFGTLLLKTGGVFYYSGANQLWRSRTNTKTPRLFSCITMFSQELLNELKERWFTYYGEHIDDDEANEVMYQMTGLMQLVINHALRTKQ